MPSYLLSWISGSPSRSPRITLLHFFSASLHWLRNNPTESLLTSVHWLPCTTIILCAHFRRRTSSLIGASLATGRETPHYAFGLLLSSLVRDTFPYQLVSSIIGLPLYTTPPSIHTLPLSLYQYITPCMESPKARTLP